jgi:hypothetical protein
MASKESLTLMLGKTRMFFEVNQKFTMCHNIERIYYEN